MMRYALLCLFILVFSLLYTLIAYCITNNPWVSTFVTVAGALIFVLENMELNKTIRELEQEISTQKILANFTLIPKINDLQHEIHQLRIMSANQAAAKTDKKLKWHNRSYSSL